MHDVPGNDGMRPIRVDEDGIAHYVGPVKELNQSHVGWYLSCHAHKLRVSDMKELPLSAPTADRVTCMLCLAEH